MINGIDSSYPQFIKMDSAIKDKYLKKLIGEEYATCFSGQEQGQLYFIAAALGFLNKTKKKTVHPTDIRLYRTLGDKYKVLIRAIVLSESNYDYDILSDGSRVLKIIEEYANGGFQILYDKVYDKGLDLSIEEEVSKLLNKPE